MKQRTSFILKGLVSLVLSLVMLCGTAVTSLSAVTVDLAQTGADITLGQDMYVGKGTAQSINKFIDPSTGNPTSASVVKMTYDSEGQYYYAQFDLILQGPGVYDFFFGTSSGINSGSNMKLESPVASPNYLSDISYTYKVDGEVANTKVNFTPAKFEKGRYYVFFVPDGTLLNPDNTEDNDGDWVVFSLGKDKIDDKVDEETEPTIGKYIFKYQDRYGTWKQKTVEVNLSADEITGYDGNGNTPKVPTYLWREPGDGGYATDPLVTASLTVTGHEGVEGETEQDDVSAYKNDIVWNFQDSTKRTVDPASNSVTIEATTTPVTFTFKYVINNGNVTVGATKVPYGKVVTFNPLYQNSNYCYIEEDIPSDGFSYWSSDPAGNNILTTNRTFGMLLRGGSAVWDNVNKVLVVTAYAQYGKDVPENKWLPEIEEATLTRTIADGEDLTYADYMTNYFNYDGIAVQDMLKDSQYNGKIKYGILVVKSQTENVTTPTLTNEQMETVLNRMHARDGVQDNPYCSSAALNNNRTRIAYRYEYDDAAHISNFNRTLYTLYGNEEKMNGYTFTAMAYITFDGGENYECSEVNTELVVNNTPSSN